MLKDLAHVHILPTDAGQNGTNKSQLQASRN
jgi:hypothetical protein